MHPAYDFCVVVNEASIVLGSLDARVLGERSVRQAIVTTSAGRLIGTVFQRDL